MSNADRFFAEAQAKEKRDPILVAQQVKVPVFETVRPGFSRGMCVGLFLIGITVSALWFFIPRDIWFVSLFGPPLILFAIVEGFITRAADPLRPHEYVTALLLALGFGFIGLHCFYLNRLWRGAVFGGLLLLSIAGFAAIERLQLEETREALYCIVPALLLSLLWYVDFWLIAFGGLATAPNRY